MTPEPDVAPSPSDDEPTPVMPWGDIFNALLAAYLKEEPSAFEEAFDDFARRDRG